MGSQVLGVYVAGFFFQFTGLTVVNYVSVFLAILIYLLVFGKFFRAHRVVGEEAVA